MVAKPVFRTGFEAVFKPVYGKKLNPVKNQLWNLKSSLEPILKFKIQLRTSFEI